VEVPEGWTVERRWRPTPSQRGVDYYWFQPLSQLQGRFAHKSERGAVIRSVAHVKIVFATMDEARKTMDYHKVINTPWVTETDSHIVEKKRKKQLKGKEKYHNQK